MATITIDIGDLCTYCGRDTALGSKELLFVNRIPSGSDGKLTLSGGDGEDEVTLDVNIYGYMCAECQAIDCDRCGKPSLDYEHVNDGTETVCPDCLIGQPE